MPSSQLVCHSCHCSLHFQSKDAQGSEGNIISEITLGALSAAMRHASWEASMAVLRYLVAKSLCGGGRRRPVLGDTTDVSTEYFEMTITCTVFVPPMIFVVDPPVVGSYKFLIYISLKKKTHIGIPKPGFPKLHFFLRLDAEDASCPIGHLCGKPFAASARVPWHNPRGACWLGDLAFFVFPGRLARLFVGHICIMIDYLWKHLVTASYLLKYLCRLWSWLCFVLL